MSGTGVHREKGGGRALLRDVAYDHVRDRILDGSSPPGTFLSEREVAGELQMSKTPVRVAFERLAEQGLVTIAPQRGVIVAGMDSTQIVDHYDLRVALETFVVRRLSERQLHAWAQAQLQANLAHQVKLVTGQVDIVGFTQADADFHLILASALGNGEILQIMNRQRDRVRHVVDSIFRRDPRVPPMSCAEHSAIAEAVLDRDAERAAELMTVHLENGQRFLLLGGTYGER